MKPGPTTAKKIRIRIFQRLKKVMRTRGFAQATDQHKWSKEIWIGEIADSGPISSTETPSLAVGRRPKLTATGSWRTTNDHRLLLQISLHHTDDVIRGDDSGQF